MPTGELNGGGRFLLGHPDVELAEDVHDGADIDFLVELVDSRHDFAELVGLDEDSSPLASFSASLRRSSLF